MNVCPERERESQINHSTQKKKKTGTRVRARTVEIHERFERPVLGVVAVGVVVRPAKREGPEMRSLRQFWIVGDLGAPLCHEELAC